jgi:hypothetical protein
MRKRQPVGKRPPTRQVRQPQSRPGHVGRDVGRNFLAPNTRENGAQRLGIKTLYKIRLRSNYHE